jgi:hypothetical protein
MSFFCNGCEEDNFLGTGVFAGLVRRWPLGGRFRSLRRTGRAAFGSAVQLGEEVVAFAGPLGGGGGVAAGGGDFGEGVVVSPGFLEAEGFVDFAGFVGLALGGG